MQRASLPVRLILVGALFAALAGLIWVLVSLGGCTSTTTTGNQEAGPRLEVSLLADRRTVYADASSYVAVYGDSLEFYWDWGDGSGLVQGDPVMSHTYAVPGAYVIRLKIVGVSPGTSVGDPGAPPGGIPPSPGSGTTWVARTVNLLDSGYPIPIVVVNNLGQVEEREVLLPTHILFDASRSYSPDNRPLWFRWEIVCVDPVTKQPIPYPYEGCVICPTEPEFIRREGARFMLDYLPSPGCCLPSSPWMYRVRCWVSDDLGRIRMWEGYIKVGAC